MINKREIKSAIRVSIEMRSNELDYPNKKK